MKFSDTHIRFLKDWNINMVLIAIEELDTTLTYNDLNLNIETHVFFIQQHVWA
jgi:hypothetical protein